MFINTFNKLYIYNYPNIYTVQNHLFLSEVFMMMCSAQCFAEDFIRQGGPSNPRPHYTLSYDSSAKMPRNGV